LTWSIGGWALRAGIKHARYEHALRWQDRSIALQESLPAKARFEDALSRIEHSGRGRGTAEQRRAFDDAVQAVDRYDASAGEGRAARTARLNDALGALQRRAAEVGADDPTLFSAMGEGAAAKVRFDTALATHDAFTRRLEKPTSFRNLLAGIPRADRPGLRDEVQTLKTAVTRLRAADPADRSAALSDSKAAVETLHIAPKLRGPDSLVRWAIDGSQAGTYAVGLGYVVHDLGNGQFFAPATATSPTAAAVTAGATAAFALANSADAVRIVGTRLGTKLPGFRSRAGEPGVDRHPLFRSWLAFGDEALTTLGGVALMAKAGVALHDGGVSIGRVFDGGVATVYTAAQLRQFGNSVGRRFVEPDPGDLAARRPYLTTRRMAAGASLLLAASYVANALAGDGDDSSGAVPPVKSPDAAPTSTTTPPTPTTTTPTPSPTPTPTPSATPTTKPAPPTKETKPTDPTDTDPPTERPGRPPQRDAPAQVVVRAGDPRRATLWGIAEANQRTLLSPAQIEADRREGGDVAVVADALQQLLQLNRERGFRPELMDGVATSLRGDPDTVQPGWALTVENLASG
jgi:hypothetical protein